MMIFWASNRAAFKGGQKFLIAGLLVAVHSVTSAAPAAPATDAPTVLYLRVEPFVVIGNAEPEIPVARLEPDVVTMEV